jgi:hypothetical protein
MDTSTIIEYIVLATVVIVLIHLYKYLYLDFYINLIQIPITGSETLLFPQPLSSAYKSFFSTIVSLTTMPFIYILIFYLLFYGLYLLIIWILDQGWLFFLHPIFSPLLDAPPFKELIKFGVFKLLEGIFITFGISPLLKAIYNLYLSIYIFSNSNTKYIFNLIAPGLGDKVVAYMEKYKGKSANTVKEEINKEKEEEENNPKKQIEISVQAIIANKLKPITPDLDSTDKNNIFISNNNEIINAYSKKIGDYIKLSY